MLRAYVSDDPSAFGVAISVAVTEGDSSRPAQFMRLVGGSDGYAPSVQWEPVQDTTAIAGPTLRLGHETARAVLDALLHHYEGASDMHTARADLMHERGRVDKLTDALVMANAAAVALLTTRGPYE